MLYPTREAEVTEVIEVIEGIEVEEPEKFHYFRPFTKDGVVSEDNEWEWDEDTPYATRFKKQGTAYWVEAEGAEYFLRMHRVEGGGISDAWFVCRGTQAECENEMMRRGVLELDEPPPQPPQLGGNMAKSQEKKGFKYYTPFTKGGREPEGGVWDKSKPRFTSFKKYGTAYWITRDVGKGTSRYALRMMRNEPAARESEAWYICAGTEAECEKEMMRRGTLKLDEVTVII